MAASKKDTDAKKAAKAAADAERDEKSAKTPDKTPDRKKRGELPELGNKEALGMLIALAEQADKIFEEEESTREQLNRLKVLKRTLNQAHFLRNNVQHLKGMPKRYFLPLIATGLKPYRNRLMKCFGMRK